MALFGKENVFRLEVAIDYVTVVEVFKCEKDFSGVEFGDFLLEDFLSAE